MDDTEEEKVRRVNSRQWQMIQEYERSTLNRFNYCVYSCAYRPLNTNVYCSFSITSPMTVTSYNLRGPEWLGVKEFRIFYQTIFKQFLHEFPSVQLFAEETSTRISSLEISNTEIMAVLTVLSSVRKVSEIRIRIGVQCSLPPFSSDFFSASLGTIQSLSNAIEKEMLR